MHMNLIFEESIKDAKDLPDFTGTDDHFVRLRLGALVTNPDIIKLFKEIGDTTLSSFSTDDFRIVRYVMGGESIPKSLRHGIGKLLNLGVIERVDRSRLVLAQKYYQRAGLSGRYTRLKGLTDEASKELLCQHMRNESNRGLRLTEFSQVLPSYSARKIQRLLNALKSDGKVSVEGLTRAARWYLTNLD